jgi:hypothetical protein
MRSARGVVGGWSDVSAAGTQAGVTDSLEQGNLTSGGCDFSISSSSVLKVSAVHPHQHALPRGEIGGHDCRVCVWSCAPFAPLGL